MKIKAIARSLDTFTKIGKREYFAEYNGFHFEACSEKALFNKILKYIFETIGWKK